MANPNINPKKYYVLRNDEMGWVTTCPVFTDKRKADGAAACKCRKHTVVEAKGIPPCHPVKAHRGCLECPRYQE